MVPTNSTLRSLIAIGLLTLSLCLPLCAQTHVIPSDTSGLQLVAPGSLPAIGGSYWYLSRTNSAYPPSPALSAAARAAQCPVYLLPWSTDTSPAYLVDDTAIADAVNTLHALTAMAAPALADTSTDVTPQASMPPSGYAPCDAYKEFWCSHIQASPGGIQLTLSNTLPGLQYVILQADSLSNPSWTPVQTVPATGFVTTSSPISAGAGATHFFRASLAYDYAGPLILSPPQSCVVPPGRPATFTVLASGLPTPAYQWEFDGLPISGATHSSYTIPSAQPANVGTYTVIVSNVLCQASASACLGLSWTNLLDSPISASPAVSTNGTVFIATQSRFYALDPLRGAIKWSTSLDNTFSPDDLAPSPALAPDNSAVYVASQAGILLALNPTTGAPLWSHDLGNPIYASPVVSPADGTVYAITSGGNPSALFAFNPATGTTNWIYQPQEPAYPGNLSEASPALGPDGTIYFIATSGDLYALHPDGSLAWFFPFPAGWAPQSSPAIDGAGNLLVGSSDGYLYCISPEGTLKWLFNTTDASGLLASPAIGADGTVYVASYYGGWLYAVTNGALKWQCPLTNAYTSPLAVVSSPAVTANNVVLIGACDYVGHASGLYAITNGALAAFYPTPGFIRSSPAISPVDGAVLIADFDPSGIEGHVYQFPGQGPLAPDAPWPAFRHDARHSGAMPSPARAGAGPSAFPNNPRLTYNLDTFIFYLSGTPGTRWNLHASTNLTDWTPCGVVLLDPATGNASFTDPAVTGVPCRFYRATLGPICSPIIGFTWQTLLPGTNLVANPLFQVNDYYYPPNTAQGWTALLKDNNLPKPPGQTEIRKWNGVGFDSIAYNPTFSGWLPNGDLTLLPGQATFFVNPSTDAATLPFMGLVASGIPSTPIAPGASYLSSILPKAGRIQSDLGFNPNDGDKVLLWRTNHFSTNTWSANSGSWSGSEPSLTLGEGFLLLTTQSNNWVSAPPACASGFMIVPANPLWTDTGLRVTIGDHVVFPAIGTWDPGTGIPCGPEGYSWHSGDWLANTNWAGLLAFIGPNPYCDAQGINRWGDYSSGYFPRPQGTNYYYLGTNVVFTAKHTGELWFGFNDDALGMQVGDNSGFVYGPLTITNR